jgi:DNA primase large subunit
MPAYFRDYSGRIDATIKQQAKVAMRNVILHSSDTEGAFYHMFPPCVAVLLGCCARGEHLEHNERVYLASFMAVAGWDPESVIEPLFKSMPDYDSRRRSEWNECI